MASAGLEARGEGAAAAAAPVAILAHDVHPTLRRVLEARGWEARRASEEDEGMEAAASAGPWSLAWRTKRFSRAFAEAVPRGRLTNHFAGTTLLTSKHRLARMIARMARSHRALYSFAPRTFVLPPDAERLRRADAAEQAREGKEGADGPPRWICKPVTGSRGRDIYLARSAAEVREKRDVVVQSYLGEPYLVGGFKFDVRLYAAVTSVRPLRVHLYRRGLARFSTQPYGTGAGANLFAHLTNSSINRDSPDIGTDKRVVGVGAKWTLRRLMSYLRTRGVATRGLWRRIRDIVVLAALPLACDIEPDGRCFEVFGFDVMLDDCARPWLLEVNSSPAIAIGTPEDQRVKWRMLNDLLDLVGARAAPGAPDPPACERTFGRYGDPDGPPPAEGDDDHWRGTAEARERDPGRWCGDWERVFPFDESTAHAADELAGSCETGAEPPAAAREAFFRAACDAVRARRRGASSSSSAGGGGGAG